MTPSSKLIIGTAQFGQNYGITNLSGKVPEMEVKAILSNAKANQIQSLDTASSYGNSELVLGSVGVSGFDIITKLPALGQSSDKCYEIYLKFIQSSIKKLRKSSIETVLLHRPEELSSSYGTEIYKALLKFKENGLVEKIGVSIYSPELLDAIIPKYRFDVIQVPINIFDRRIISSGWLSRLSEMGISVIARSVFLQGVLLSKIDELPTYFSQWRSHFKSWIEFCHENRLSALEAALQFILNVPEIDKIIVGVESERQLIEIIRAMNNPLAIKANDLEISDLGLINPVQWTK